MTTRATQIIWLCLDKIRIIFVLFPMMLNACAKANRSSSSSSKLAQTALEDNLINGKPPPDRSVDAHGRYYAMTKQLFTGDLFCETGQTPKEANELAMELCRDNSQDRAGCVLSISAMSTLMLPRESGYPMEKWSCFVEETAAGEGPSGFRTWVSCDHRAKTRKQAESVAKDRCQQEGAASSCRNVRCFNIDPDKRYR